MRALPTNERYRVSAVYEIGFSLFRNIAPKLRVDIVACPLQGAQIRGSRSLPAHFLQHIVPLYVIALCPPSLPVVLTRPCAHPSVTQLPVFFVSMACVTSRSLSNLLEDLRQARAIADSRERQLKDAHAMWEEGEARRERAEADVSM